MDQSATHKPIQQTMEQVPVVPLRVWRASTTILFQILSVFAGQYKRMGILYLFLSLVILPVIKLNQAPALCCPIQSEICDTLVENASPSQAIIHHGTSLLIQHGRNIKVLATFQKRKKGRMSPISSSILPQKIPRSIIFAWFLLMLSKKQ